MMRIDDKLRRDMRSATTSVHGSPGAWGRLQRRIQRRTMQRRIAAIASAAALLVCAGIGVRVLQRDVVSGPIAGPTPDPGNPTISNGSAFWYGLEPIDGAREANRRFADGEAPWRDDVRQVALTFFRDVLGVDAELVAFDVEDVGRLGRWDVQVRPVRDGRAGPIHHVWVSRFVDVPGAIEERPAPTKSGWFVSEVHSENLQIDLPYTEERITRRPVRVRGIDRTETPTTVTIRPELDEPALGTADVISGNGLFAVDLDADSSPTDTAVLVASGSGPAPMNWSIVRVRMDKSLGTVDRLTEGVTPTRWSREPPTHRLGALAREMRSPRDVTLRRHFSERAAASGLADAFGEVTPGIRHEIIWEPVERSVPTDVVARIYTGIERIQSYRNDRFHLVREHGRWLIDSWEPGPAHEVQAVRAVTLHLPAKDGSVSEFRVSVPLDGIQDALKAWAHFDGSYIEVESTSPSPASFSPPSEFVRSINVSGDVVRVVTEPGQRARFRSSMLPALRETADQFPEIREIEVVEATG